MLYSHLKIYSYRNSYVKRKEEEIIIFCLKMFFSFAGKITGMLLEIDNAELVHMLEDQTSLKGKVSKDICRTKCSNSGFSKPVS